MYTNIIDLDEAGKYRLYCRRRSSLMLLPGEKAPALLMVPGGGFAFCEADDQEAMLYKFMSYGYHVFTYTYAVGADYRFPDVIIYLSRALKLIRDHADDWAVDPKRIVVGGCSAGAHIAASLGGIWNRPMIQEPAGCSGEENRPSSMMLCYGPLYCNQKTEDGLIYVPTGDFVGPHTPPTFVAHCADDDLVPVDQSLGYATALCKAGVPFSVYISGNGNHGGLQNVRAKISRSNQLTVAIDDWFPAFLKFTENAFGNSPIPEKEMDMLPPEVLPDGLQPDGSGQPAATDGMELPELGPVYDADGNRMGTFAAGLRLDFSGRADEPFDNILR